MQDYSGSLLEPSTFKAWPRLQEITETMATQALGAKNGHIWHSFRCLSCAHSDWVIKYLRARCGLQKRSRSQGHPFWQQSQQNQVSLHNILLTYHIILKIHNQNTYKIAKTRISGLRIVHEFLLGRNNLISSKSRRWKYRGSKTTLGCQKVHFVY